MDAYQVANWHDLFVAELGASTGLAGLVFVGVSINLKQVMSYPWLPGRALEAILMLVLVLVASTLVLVPGQPAWALGAEVLVAALLTWAGVAIIHRHAFSTIVPELRRQLLARVVLGEAVMVAFAVSGVSLVAQAGGGLYWLVPAVVLATVAAVAN